MGAENVSTVIVLQVIGKSELDGELLAKLGKSCVQSTTFEFIVNDKAPAAGTAFTDERIGLEKLFADVIFVFFDGPVADESSYRVRR